MKIFPCRTKIPNADRLPQQRKVAFWLSNSVAACLLALISCGVGCSAPTLPEGNTTADSSGDAVADQTGADQTGADQATGDQTSADTKVDTTPAVACKLDTDCPTTKVQCYVAFCDAGTCDIKPTTSTQTCNDGNACTEADSCSKGKCVGTAKTCNDDNPCTIDLCAPASGCVFNNLDKPCKTDDICTLHACQAGACVVVNPNPCDDNNSCTTDSCDPKLGCQYKALTAVNCDDGDSCTKGDVCKFGQCVGKGKSCNDNNPCTDDGCDAAGVCANVPNSKPCSDAKPCTQSDTCAGGTCTGTPKNCEDGSPCTVNTCDPLTGACNVGLPSTPTPCDDGNACTTGETCASFVCQPGMAKSCDDGNDCTIDACVPTTGECEHKPAADGDACGGSNLCLVDAKCELGQCIGSVKNCDDNNPCTTDLCDPSTGLCTQANAVDGTACGENLTCQSGVCL